MKRNKKGFTMVELLVVLVIVAILAAVATPIYLANVKRSRASEAVSTMSLIRQALRDYQINASTYFDINVAGHTINLPLPNVANITVATGAVSTNSGVNVNAGTARYFSNAAFTVDAAGTGGLTDPDGLSNLFTSPAAVDFIITANGVNSVNCATAAAGTTDCATRQTEVGTAGSYYVLEMDNSGRTFVCYDYTGAACTSGWSAY